MKLDNSKIRQNSWTPELSVGFKVIDKDHKLFFEMADIFNSQETSRKHKKDVEAAIRILIDYINGHFLREENAMLDAKYPSLHAHKEEHKNFKAAITIIVTEHYAGNNMAVRELGKTFAEWWPKHIATVDRQYMDWIKETDIDPRPLHEVSGILNQNEIDSVW